MLVQLPHCPILTPTFEQFQNFSDYVTKVEQQYRGQYGMVKIVPPKQWVSRGKNYSQILENLKITKPEYQTLYGHKNNFYFCCKNQRHPQMSLSQYKKMACKKQREIDMYTTLEGVEAYFWQRLSTLSDQLYGANVQQSLMDNSAGQWQFSHLKSFFTDIVTEKIHGLNTSFLFVGAWRTFFNWHIQDLDLSAINLLHEGKPKMWYGVHPQDRKKFQRILSDLFRQESNACSNFMRHKQMFVNPYKLIQKHPYLRISKMYQCQGEISLAFAEAYHSGFNMGYNIAEAVNYGTIDWLERYAKFRGCKCPLKIGVCLSHKQMLQNIKNSQYYDKIKESDVFKKLFKKIEEQIEKDNLPTKLLEQADDDEIEQEIKKAKEKPINKGKKNVYVAKYNRYFSVEKPGFLQCDSCNRWKKVGKQIYEQFKDKPTVTCCQIGYNCRPSKAKKLSKTNNKQ